MSLNSDLSSLFSSMADLMDIKGENTFKVLAFRKVSRLLGDLTADARQLLESGALAQMEGIGKATLKIIEEYAATGRSADHESLAHSVPSGLPPLLQIEGLGPKTISLLWKERNITSADELKAALDKGALAGLKGIGDKKIELIRRGLELAATRKGRVGIGHALPLAQDFLARLRAIPLVLRAELAGSLRRMCETIGDVDFVCSVKKQSDGEKITAAFVQFPGIDRILGQGPSKASVVTASGTQVDLRVLPELHFGAALLYFTGSKEHNVKIRGLAQKKNLTLNEWGLYRLDEYEKSEKKTAEAPSIKPVASKTEEEIYSKLGLAFIEPELRENRGEVELAAEKNLPKLIRREDLKGDLHCHTTASDGTATIEEMALAAKALGYSYLAITDHSKSQVIANGLSPDRLLAHIAEIRKVSARLKGITLLAGAEVDILPDGSLDYEDAILAQLDIVVASPHFALKQDQPKATDRLLRAIENKYVNIIGHPTGRLINGREGLPLDFTRMFLAAAQSHTALEINAGYPRLDLNEHHSRSAAQSGVMISIDTDAHSAPELNEIQYGLSTARRAALEPRHVLNVLPLSQLQQFLKRKR
jgi:DNA polymerase (family 10)